jgi:hypothetical protein
VAPGGLCNATQLAVGPSVKAGVQTGEVIGLTMSTDYTCYVIATNTVGSVCSPAKDVSIPDGFSFTIFHRNGTQLRTDVAASRYIRLRSGVNATFRSFAQRDVSTKWVGVWIHRGRSR